MKEVAGADGDGEPGDPALDALSRTLALTLGVRTVTMSLIDADGQYFLGGHGLHASMASSRRSADVNPLCKHVLATSRPVIVYDATRRAGGGESTLTALGVVGYAGVPMFVDHAAVGVVAAIDSTLRAWTARDLELLRAFADAAAAILMQRNLPSRSHGIAAAALVHERALTSFLVRIATSASASDALEHIVRHTGWPYAELVSLEASWLRIIASSAVESVYRDFVPAAQWPIEEDTLIRSAFLTGRPVWLTELAHQVGYARGPRAEALGLATGFAIAVPGHSTALALFTSEAAPERWRVSRVAPAMAALLRPALVAMRVRDGDVHERRTGELELLALHDELTGLLNRRGFYAVAGGQLAIARRKKLPGVVLFIDIDGLKTRNDVDGHAAGDDLLRTAAEVLRATFREADTIGRVGGDEFVVFSVDAVGHDLPAIVDRLGDELRRSNVSRESGTQLRWSVGSAAFEAEDVADLDTLIVEADRRMYDAKRARHLKPLG